MSDDGRSFWVNNVRITVTLTVVISEDIETGEAVVYDLSVGFRRLLPGELRDRISGWAVDDLPMGSVVQYQPVQKRYCFLDGTPAIMGKV